MFTHIPWLVGLFYIPVLLIVLQFGWKWAIAGKDPQRTYILDTWLHKLIIKVFNEGEEFLADSSDENIVITDKGTRASGEVYSVVLFMIIIAFPLLLSVFFGVLTVIGYLTVLAIVSLPFFVQMILISLVAIFVFLALIKVINICITEQ